MTDQARARELTRDRVRRFRARAAGQPEPPTRAATHCAVCGARLSMYAPREATTCAAHEPYAITHEDYLEDVAREHGEAPTRCKRGHDLDAHGIITSKGAGVMRRICGACKRERDAAYARARRSAA